MNKALKLVKIMKTGPSIPNNTGSRLLQKVTKTSCEEFNRKVFNLLDLVKTMEHKYKMLTPDQLLKDADYDKYGPIGLISTLHDIYGRLITDRDWPASNFLRVTTLLLLLLDHPPTRRLVRSSAFAAEVLTISETALDSPKSKTKRSGLIGLSNSMRRPNVAMGMNHRPRNPEVNFQRGAMLNQRISPKH